MVRDDIYYSWYASGASETDAALTVTKAAKTNMSHYVSKVVVRVTDANMAAALQVVLIKDGSTVIGSMVLPASSAVGYQGSIDFPLPVRITRGAALNVVVPALGAGSKSACYVYGATA